MKKKSRPKAGIPALPKGWTIPALADRRHGPRPARETPQQRARAAAKRKRES
jgi:hypothetical protein